MDKRIIIYGNSEEYNNDILMKCVSFSSSIGSEVNIITSDFEEMKSKCKLKGLDVITYSMDTLGGQFRYNTLLSEGIQVYFVKGESTLEVL